jgi:hypothetical protein
MIVISGFAEYAIEDNSKFTKGDRHSIGLFSKNKDCPKNLAALKNFVNQLGWGSIMFTHIEEVKDTESITHDTLRQAFKRASKNGQSFVVNDLPISLH